MEARFHSRFEKQYRQYDPKRRSKVDQRLILFLKDSNHPLLRNHALSGSWSGFWSINVTGDIRALYYYVDGSTVLFTHLDTHSHLYG